jgi:hypothetical protein
MPLWIASLALAMTRSILAQYHRCLDEFNDAGGKAFLT